MSPSRFATEFLSHKGPFKVTIYMLVLELKKLCLRPCSVPLLTLQAEVTGRRETQDTEGDEVMLRKSGIRHTDNKSFCVY